MNCKGWFKKMASVSCQRWRWFWSVCVCSVNMAGQDRWGRFRRVRSHMDNCILIMSWGSNFFSNKFCLTNDSICAMLQMGEWLSFSSNMYGRQSSYSCLVRLCNEKKKKLKAQSTGTDRMLHRANARDHCRASGNASGCILKEVWSHQPSSGIVAPIDWWQR